MQVGYEGRAVPSTVYGPNTVIICLVGLTLILAVLAGELGSFSLFLVFEWLL